MSDFSRFPIDLINYLIKWIFYNHEHFPDDFDKEETFPFVYSLELEKELKRLRDELSPDGKYTGKEWYEEDDKESKL